MSTRCWTTSDIVRLITDPVFNPVWNDPAFTAFVMKYEGKLVPKYVYSLENIESTISNNNLF